MTCDLESLLVCSLLHLLTLVILDEELEEEVGVGVLVEEGDEALLLQVDRVDEGDGALVPVGLYVAALGNPRRGVAGDTVVSTVTVVEVGRHAAEAGRDGVPLVEADAAAQRVASCGAQRALLRGHLQELTCYTGERALCSWYWRG